MLFFCVSFRHNTFVGNRSQCDRGRKRPFTAFTNRILLRRQGGKSPNHPVRLPKPSISMGLTWYRSQQSQRNTVSPRTRILFFEKNPAAFFTITSRCRSSAQSARRNLPGSMVSIAVFWFPMLTYIVVCSRAWLSRVANNCDSGGLTVGARRISSKRGYC
jgi:hypothetical protein